jgi:hypothetical protein
MTQVQIKKARRNWIANFVEEQDYTTVWASKVREQI